LKSYSIAVIPGDGVGTEVVDAAWIVMEKAAARHGFSLAAERFDWSCDRCFRTGRMMQRMSDPPSLAADAMSLGI
jgi:tartrate dehydrogenase/decarboxylase/D-malate dehydrogenase